jgi:LysM repeat protein
MKILFALMLLISLFVVTHGHAQNFNTSEIVLVDGQKYILHKVQEGETLYSICKKYNVDQKELVGANPQLIFGLRQGDALKVPCRLKAVSPVAKDEHQLVNPDFIYHVVKKSETVYSISKQYNVSIGSIYQFNPEAEAEILENEIIRIPKEYKATEGDGLMREDEDYYYHKVQAHENVYSLARKYNCKVNAILDLNPNAADHLEIGWIVRIPKHAQESSLEETKDESGLFFYHRIESGDTFYSYKRRFGATQQELIEFNPELNDGLLAGLTIKIPSVNIQKIESIPVNSDDFTHHLVTKGETLYSLSREMNVKILDIKTINPELKSRGLIAGETILLPANLLPAKKDFVDKEQKTTFKTKPLIEIIQPDSLDVPDETHKPEVIFEIAERVIPFYEKDSLVMNDDTFRISMFLPLFFDKNDTFNLEHKSEKEIAFLDSMMLVDPQVLNDYFDIVIDTLGQAVDTVLVDSMKVRAVRSLYPHSKNFLSFYEGFILGVDSMTKAGTHVHLDLYDSQYNSDVIDSILYNNDFINADLIIGPVNVGLQKSVSQFSAKNQIPMVSPFDPNNILLKDNPFYFQVNPSKDYILRKTSDFIGDEFYDKNFIIMTLGDYSELKESSLVDLVRDKFFATGIYNKLDEVLFTEVDFTEGGHLGYWQVKKTLRRDVENVIFIPATDNRNEREAMLSRAFNSLYVLSEEYDITLVGVSDYQKFKSFNTEYFHRLKLKYLTPNYVDYQQDLVNDFIGNYRRIYMDEPNEYSYRGCDIALYFIGAYQQFGKNFTESISTYDAPLLQGDFNFQRVDEFGGFMNHSLYIMNYSKTYDVELISKITEGRVDVESF